MTDDTPRKTLSIRKPAEASPAADAPERKRSGGRAKQVARQTRDTLKQRSATSAPFENPRAEPATVRPPTTRSTAGRPSVERPSTERTSPTEQRPRHAGHGPADEAATPRIRRRERATPRLEIFPAFAPCPQGLEEALATELRALGFEDAQADRAGCRFHTDWPGMQRANLYSRLATRILMQVSQGPAAREDDIFNLAYETPWERWFGAEQTLRVDTSAIRSPMRSLQFCNLRAKDGICDRLRDREGERPSIDTVRPDARVHLFLDESQATLYLDTSGESLFKRGWRLDKGSAPIRENLAAGLLALSGWDPSRTLLDPFCGSGTILIEAAWIALGVPAGIWRPFGFERLRDHDARRWRDIKDDARASIAPRLDCQLQGYDLDPGAVDAARGNLARARLTPDAIRFQVGDACVISAPDEPGWLVTNPPYGERMETDSQELWRDWAANLKRHFHGWHVGVISSDLDLPGQLRLKPRRRTPLHNGALDCRLFQFDMVAAGYRD
ncbi:MAG TPA: THUMP domain-containing protein [Nevskiaceae bacterium]|nr:THUMP domain-containing protein [Nevskiaceae bacterium]